jgi:cytochrome P450
MVNINQTFVGLPQIATYRSKHNFALPNSFIPERWLSTESTLFKQTESDPFFDKETFMSDNINALQPFSVGPRDCIAQGLAKAEMRLVFSRLLWNFDLIIPKKLKRIQSVPWIEQNTYGLWVKESFIVELHSIR